MTQETKKVYQAILAVQGALADIGISKNNTCTQGASYKFRGIDDVYNALAPLLAKNNLCILPRMLAKEVVERTSKANTALFYTTVTAEFDFVSAEDGSLHTVGPIYGEAMDSGDKGMGKAMSYAYKAMAFQSFCIPTEGDNDTENQTHEVIPARSASPATGTQSGTTPSGEVITDGQQKMIFAKLKTAGREVSDLMAHLKISGLDCILRDNLTSTVKLIESGGVPKC